MAGRQIVDGIARSAPNLCDRSRRNGKCSKKKNRLASHGRLSRRTERFVLRSEKAQTTIAIFAGSRPRLAFRRRDKIACPEFTGSYLSYDGENIYLSQWYKHRILRLDASGNIIRAIDIGAEVSGHAFIDGMIYVLRGTEQNGESWTIARLDPREEKPEVKDIAVVPFACRSLTFDGANFWSNHRAANEIVSIRACRCSRWRWQVSVVRYRSRRRFRRVRTN